MLNLLLIKFKIIKMKVGLIINGRECGDWKSFYVKNGRAYLFSNDKKYNGPNLQESIDNLIFRNIWNRAFMFDGCFINSNEGLIDIDLDAIFLVCENESNPKSFVNRIREKYKNAIVMGATKETIPHLSSSSVTSIKDFLNQCDKVVTHYNEEMCNNLSNRLNMKVYSLPFPYKIDQIRDKFKIGNKEKLLLAGTASWDKDRGYDECLKFTKYLGNKYGYEVVENKDDKTWKEWLQLINKVSVVVNMDKQHRFGQVTIESLILGTNHIGGISDTSLSFTPELSTNDPTKLENHFIKIINGGVDGDRFYSKLIERHGFDNVNNKLIDIIND